MAAVADAMPQQQPNMAATTSGGSTSQGGAGAASNAAGTSGAAPQAFPAAQPQKPSNVASLYVGDLQKDVTEAQLYELFSKIGNVISIRVCRDMITRRSLGYAYVNFQNAPDAEKAMDSLNFEPLRSKPIRIMWSHRDPSLRRSGVGNIFIRNLHKAIDNKALYDTFSAFGNILSCKIVTDENSDSKGYGFVHFETEEAANRAIDKINGMQLDAQVVFVGKFVPKNEREKTFTNCYVKNLPDNVKDQELRDLFKAYGDITNATVMVDDNGKSRGFGFVSFTKHEAAERAVQATNGKDVNGKILYVARAQKKGERQQELLRVFEQKRMEAQKQNANANLYVKNIEDGLDEERLRREFATFGGIKSCKIMKDEHGRSKGFGFISYNQPAEAQAALQHMQGRTIISKPLYVAIAQRKEERTAMIQSHVQSRMMPSPSAGGAFRLPTQPNALQAQQMAAMQAVQLVSLFPYANPQMAAALQALTNNPAAAAAFAAQQGQNPRGFGFQNMPGVNMNGMRAMGPLGAQQQWQQRAAALAATAAAAAGLRGGPQAGGAGGGGGGYSLSHVAAGQQGGQYANQNAAMVAAANAAIQQQQQQAVAAAAAVQQQQQGSVQQQMTQQQLGGGGGAGGMQGQMGGGGAGGAGMMAAGGNMRNSISNMPQVTRTYGGQQQNQQQQNQQRMAPSGRPGDQQQMSAGGQYGSSQQQGGQMQQRGMAAGGQQQPGGGPPGGMRGPPSQQQQQQQQQGVRGTSVGRVPGGGQPTGAGVNGPVSGGASQQPQQQPNGIGNGQQNNGDQQSPASPKSYAGAAAQQAPAGPQPASMRQQPPRPAAGGPQANAAAAGKPAPANDIIDAAKLATMDKSMQKTVLGEKLYPKIREICPDFVGKITGMLLESMDSSDLLLMIEDSGFDFMKKKVDEAAKLLRASQKPAPGTGGATAAAAPAQPSA